MILQGTHIYLRDPSITDMEEFKLWYQPDQEWLLWDSPWEEFSSIDFETLRNNIMHRIQAKHSGIIRNRFELCTNLHQHIGWVSWYYIHYDPSKLAIGITIIPQDLRGKGYGVEAYVLYIHYLLTCGVSAIYTQTWSGNQRMIKLAEKTGFVEVERRVNYRLVRGWYYDEITYQLDLNRFFSTFC